MHNRGFTLVEIIIIIVLLGLVLPLSFIFIPKQMQRTRDAKRKSDFQALSRALEDYYQDNSTYPAALPNCNLPFRGGNEILLGSVPCDPVTNTNYYYEACSGKASSWYRLYTNLEILADPVIEELHCTSGCGPGCSYNYGVASPNIGLDICAKKYVCAPGGGRTGFCEVFENPEMSECPRIFYDDPTCAGQCGVPANRCQNASGKLVPTGKMPGPPCY